MTTLDLGAFPIARRDEVVDLLHGVEIVDPYRWLEDGASDETRAWTAAQNARTAAMLDAVPGREALESRLADLYRAGTVDAPVVRGDRNPAHTRLSCVLRRLDRIGRGARGRQSAGWWRVWRGVAPGGHVGEQTESV